MTNFATKSLVIDNEQQQLRISGDQHAKPSGILSTVIGSTHEISQQNFKGGFSDGQMMPQQQNFLLTTSKRVNQAVTQTIDKGAIPPSTVSTNNQSDPRISQRSITKDEKPCLPLKELRLLSNQTMDRRHHPVQVKLNLNPKQRALPRLAQPEVKQQRPSFMQFMEMPQDPQTPVTIQEFRNHKKLKGLMGKTSKNLRKAIPDRSASNMEKLDAFSDKTSILTPLAGQKNAQPSIVDLYSSQDLNAGQNETLRQPPVLNLDNQISIKMNTVRVASRTGESGKGNDTPVTILSARFKSLQPIDILNSKTDLPEPNLQYGAVPSRKNRISFLKSQNKSRQHNFPVSVQQIAKNQISQGVSTAGSQYRSPATRIRTSATTQPSLVKMQPLTLKEIESTVANTKDRDKQQMYQTIKQIFSSDNPSHTPQFSTDNSALQPFLNYPPAQPRQSQKDIKMMCNTASGTSSQLMTTNSIDYPIMKPEELQKNYAKVQRRIKTIEDKQDFNKTIDQVHRLLPNREIDSYHFQNPCINLVQENIEGRFMKQLLRPNIHTDRELFFNRNAKVRKDHLTQKTILRRDSLENMSFWTQSDTRKLVNGRDQKHRSQQRDNFVDTMQTASRAGQRNSVIRKYNPNQSKMTPVQSPERKVMAFEVKGLVISPPKQAKKI